METNWNHHKTAYNAKDIAHPLLDSRYNPDMKTRFGNSEICGISISEKVSPVIHLQTEKEKNDIKS